ncbi:serine/threonine-protein kinase hal4 [Diaporthe helianthi]|uniref:non-specific serine/threonine protein kinase n=1 Tax=Diaporthe helianthi TaxID=158607 RepID=A0A2P5I2F3_DIAHE|nr:serine/threonine-protein kinase hal4 [Diaporthe helianthi]
MASASTSRSTTMSSTSQPSSIRSVEINNTSKVSPQSNAQNGQAATVDQLPKQLEKASVKDRLTRMFSTKDVNRLDPNASPSKKPLPAATAAEQGSASAASTPPLKPTIPSRQASVTERLDKPAEKTPAPKSGKSTNGNGHISQRYVVNTEAQGGHEHHLRSSRRQEKLSDMFKGLLGKRAEQVPDSDLSLVSNWVDALKQEKDSTVAEKKGAPKETVTLVEKYGKCQEVVGRGAFGIVRISHKKLEGLPGEKLFAVKEFRRRPEETEKKYSKRLTAEFCISSSLRHPNVIHTLDLLKDAKGDYCEVMEFCAGGDLYTLVLAAGKLEVQEADCFFKQMMRGVEYMHEMGVAHRDLKPENLLLTTNGGLKITDFGNGECFRMAWENDAHMVSGLCGSAPYIAPEEYIDKEFDARAVDVWACGVIYMAMRTGRHLWRVAKKDEDEFYARYLKGRRDEEGYGPIESLHRARCRNVIYSILDPNPTRRITASQVLKSEWGREIKLCKAGEEGL